MSTIVETSSFARTSRTNDGATAIVLHDAERTARLDALFHEHFARARQPGLRVLVNHAMKRCLDILAALVGLLLALPVIAVSGLATWCDSGRPIFYTQMRRVRFGRRARIFKLRTLIVGSDQRLSALVNIKHHGRYLNIGKDESSYTRVGRWLERLWIVELPQLWNVLRGEMSLVGNRPLPDYVIQTLEPTAEIVERFASPQGLTGYVQIIGRDHVTDEQRVRLEYKYSRIFETGNVFLEDLRIIALTIRSYLGLGRRMTFEDVIGREEAEDFRADGCRSAPADVAEPESDSQHMAGVMACPTCYVVSDACVPDRCQQECVSSCGHSAIRLENGRATILDDCVACSECVVACPLRSIDKAPLRPNGEGVSCAQCGTLYPCTDGIVDLLPRNERLQKSPYFDFYEQEYVPANPEMHTEDTEWKLRELHPLVDGPGRYESLFDLGCGAGILGRTLARDLHVPHHCLSDWSSSILGVARRQNGGGTFVRSDAAYLPFRNGAFGLSLLIDVVEHQDKPDQVLLELSRISRKMLFRTPLEDCAYERVRRRRKDLFHESSGHVVHFDLGSVRRRLEQRGWRIRRDCVRHIAWSHWRRVVAGPTPLGGKITALGRALLRWVVPKALYRHLFVTNYNALCVSRFTREPALATLKDSGETSSTTAAAGKDGTL